MYTQTTLVTPRPLSAGELNALKTGSDETLPGQVLSRLLAIGNLYDPIIMPAMWMAGKRCIILCGIRSAVIVLARGVNASWRRRPKILLRQEDGTTFTGKVDKDKAGLVFVHKTDQSFFDKRQGTRSMPCFAVGSADPLPEYW